MMYHDGETTAAMLTRFANEAGRTLRGTALDLRLPVNLFHRWATGRSLPSSLMVPIVAKAIGMDVDELASHVAAERTEDRPAPTSSRDRSELVALRAKAEALRAASAALVRDLDAAIASTPEVLGVPA